jgi:hypothetical protein
VSEKLTFSESNQLKRKANQNQSTKAIDCGARLFSIDFLPQLLLIVSCCLLQLISIEQLFKHHNAMLKQSKPVY